MCDLFPLELEGPVLGGTDMGSNLVRHQTGIVITGSLVVEEKKNVSEFCCLIFLF